MVDFDLEMEESQVTRSVQALAKAAELMAEAVALRAGCFEAEGVSEVVAISLIEGKELLTYSGSPYLSAVVLVMIDRSLENR